MPDESMSTESERSSHRYRGIIVWLVRISLALALGLSIVVAIGYWLDKPYITRFGDGGIAMAKPTVMVTILLSLSGFGLLTLTTKD